MEAELVTNDKFQLVIRIWNNVEDLKREGEKLELASKELARQIAEKLQTKFQEIVIEIPDVIEGHIDWKKLKDQTQFGVQKLSDKKSW